jgi:hypothetical protein
MAECDSLREQWPLLLTESLDPARRESAHQHIESCSVCRVEWNGFQETWLMLGELPELEPPARIKQKFLAQISPDAVPDNVVPMHRRPAARWLAQAAAVVVLVGGSYFAGQKKVRILPDNGPVLVEKSPAMTQPVSLTSPQPFFRIAESSVLSAGDVNPTIEGRPDIENVQFSRPAPDKVGLSFDITSHVTVNGSPTDKSMVRLMSYVLENEDRMSPSRSHAIDLVRQAYSNASNTDPEIARSLAKVMRSDSPAGVRIKAVDTLTALPPSATSDTRDALIQALKSDPNPAVRIKAVEALAALAKSGQTLDTNMLNTLREKATQDDENPYVRVKAAEALSNARP